MFLNYLFGAIAFVAFLSELSNGTTMNIQINNPVVFRNPNTGGRNNLFGTSIGLSENSNSMFIGAPKFSYGGGVFRCDISRKSCDILGGFDKYGRIRNYLYLLP